ncbi:MAG TPA: ATP-binding protein [Caulobacteraceae bacterium]|jgi:light-regulated signal transduction histidine kinase (bacteriophytochrome)|nr:ATP-binding protein [Caulobacteraceae bacterium]
MREPNAFAPPVSSDTAALEKELRDFTYVVAHDVGACFRQITEFSKLFEKELGGDLSPRAKDSLDCIRAASESARTLLQELTAYVCVQRAPLEPKVLDGALAVRLAAFGVEGLREAGCELLVEPLGDVYADPKLFTQAIVCLLENAVKFRRPGVSSCIEACAAHTDQMWRVRICDNGRGLDEAYRDKAFMMFRRASGDEGIPGAGVGLAVCRRIARRHGGEVQFIDRDGGACVELSLPKVSAAADAAEGAGRTHDDSSKMSARR